MAVLALLLAACNGVEETEEAPPPGEDPIDEAEAAPVDADPVTLSYWLWDTNQRPVYEECAQAFTAQNPHITIDFEVFGWVDYWSGLSTHFTAGDPPDVFWNHLLQYPEMYENGVIRSIDDFVARDGIDLDQYQPGLVDLYLSPEGELYGLPKDFHVTALVVNTAMLDDAGVTLEELENAAWNPQDGGDFEDIVARLAVDSAGNRGDEAGFDASNVEVYGLTPGPASTSGNSETGYSAFAAMNGWDVLDENPWGRQYQYDDPTLVEVVEWWKSLIDRGYMPSPDVYEGLGTSAMFASEQTAISIDGSWMITHYKDTGLDIAFVPYPVGPEGRQRMTNPLADAIASDSQHPEEAWEWVKFLASIDCQRIVGESGVVFPSIPEATELALQRHADDGHDVSAFTIGLDDPDGIYHYPITSHGGEVSAIGFAAFQEILLGEAEVEERLQSMNAEINALFE